MIQTIFEGSQIYSIHGPNHTPSPSSSSSFPPQTIGPSIQRPNERPTSSITFPPYSGHTIPRLDIPASLNYSPKFGDTLHQSPASEQDSSPAVSQSSGESSLRSLEQTTLLPQAEPGEAIYHLNSSMSVVSGTLEGLVERLINTNSMAPSFPLESTLIFTSFKICKRTSNIGMFY